jgi:hypothetical protein
MTISMSGANPSGYGLAFAFGTQLRPLLSDLLQDRSLDFGNGFGRSWLSNHGFNFAMVAGRMATDQPRQFSAHILTPP